MIFFKKHLVKASFEGVIIAQEKINNINNICETRTLLSELMPNDAGSSQALIL